jgi:DNA-binding response OmpR family regulator
MSNTQRISILEDAFEIQTMLVDALSEAGYEVKAYSRAQSFEQDLAHWQPALCVVDLGLPDKDGLAILNHISAHSNAAILVVSGRASLSDKIAGLELGADDYLTKPFEMSELIARVRALMRRTGPLSSTQDKQTFRFSGWTVDLPRYLLVDADGREERLSASEVALLEIFLKRPNRLITRDQIREGLGDRSDDLSFDRAIDVRVSRLRSKLKDSSKHSKIIQTVYGAGYILISEVT